MMAENTGTGEEKAGGIFTNEDWGPGRPEFKTAAEYADEVRKWLHQAYQWQCFAAYFPFVLMCQQALQPNQGQSATSTSFIQHPLSVAGLSPPRAPGHGPQTHLLQPAGRGAEATGGQQPARQTQERGVEYKIPPLWKRFAAEFLDFLILFILKLVVTFVAVDFFKIINIDKYDFDVLHSEAKLDYKIALEMTSEIVMLELVHRLVVCVFEVLCLHRGTRTEGGATPGKSIVGLKVVLCDRIVPAAGGRAVVYPATDLGLWWAFCRSFIKNLSLAFFFPIYFTFFFLQYNRTLYDVLCHSVVVEEN